MMIWFRLPSLTLFSSLLRSRLLFFFGRFRKLLPFGRTLGSLSRPFLQNLLSSTLYPYDSGLRDPGGCRDSH
jgi:hypothetical protein